MSFLNIYNDTLQAVPSVIPNGETASPFVSTLQMPNGGGKSELVGLLLPAAFPSGNITFRDKQISTDSPAQVWVIDGVEGGLITIPFIGGSIAKIPLQPYWFVSSGLIGIVSSVAMSEDTTIKFIFQPIIQSAA